MPNTPAQVFRRAMDLLLAKDMAGFVALFSPDTVMEFPFAPPDQPHRLEGQAAVHAYLGHYPDLLDVREINEVVVHETANPEVVIAEVTASGIVVGTGLPYSMRYIAVLTVRDGLLVHYRDYWNPLTARELLGQGLVRS